MLTKLFFLLSLLYDVQGSSQNEEFTNKTEALREFPSDFWFGASTSSYQIEGAWNDGVKVETFCVSPRVIHLGKGVHMWDYLVRTDPDHIQDRTTGDDAAKSYYFYKRDVEMLKELGAHIYRFSICWTRILPYGRPNWINQEGIAYYNNLINELIKNGIIPIVTIYHWELPQNLNEQGGWIYEDIVKWFGDYARVLFQQFGDRVKYWITLNEPQVHCDGGYANGRLAPKHKSPGIEYYTCGRNMLLAHAAAYHMYKDEFYMQGGQIGISLNFDQAYSSDESEANIEALLDFQALYIGHFMDPIFSEQGNYPQRLIHRVGNKSASQGYPESRLRPFTKEQAKYIRKSADFLSLNTYTSFIIYRNDSLRGSYEIPSFHDDAFIGTYRDPSWVQGNVWIFSNPPGLYDLLMYIKKTYNNPTVYITENGFPTDPGFNDDMRVTYLTGHLESVLNAIYDGVNIRGYSFWSLMDTFEWTFGYTKRLGLYEVDFDDPMRTRTPRKSALVYRKIIRTRVIDVSYDLISDCTNAKVTWIMLISGLIVNMLLCSIIK